MKTKMSGLGTRKGGSILLRRKRAPSRRNRETADAQYEAERERDAARRALTSQSRAELLDRLGGKSEKLREDAALQFERHLKRVPEQKQIDEERERNALRPKKWRRTRQSARSSAIWLGVNGGICMQENISLHSIVRRKKKSRKSLKRKDIVRCWTMAAHSMSDLVAP